MMQSKNTEQQWENAIEIYQQLSEFGLIAGQSIVKNSRLKEMVFKSEDFVFVFGIDVQLQEIYSFWLDARSSLEIPEPILAICYFSDSLEKIIERYKCSVSYLDDINIAIQIYRDNAWVLESNSWVQNKDFIFALNKANDWMWGECRPLKKWEFEIFLNNLNLKNLP